MSAGACTGRIQWEPRTFANELGTYIQYEPEKYDDLLALKVSHLETKFRCSGFLPPDVTVEVSPSVSRNYRSRCKFGVAVKEGELCYVMWEFGMEEADRVYFKQFPLASTEVNSLMLRLLEELPRIPELRQQLVRAHFLCATTGDAIVTLLYNSPLPTEWPTHAAVLGERLRCSVMARSREEGASPNPRFWQPTCTVGRSYVNEAYQLRDGRRLRYKQPEGSFSNPNASVCVGTLNWLCSVASSIEGAEGHFFLELYCGNGNHTVALSPYFLEVVGVELDAALVEAANENLHSNGVTNARVYCLSSGKYCSTMLKFRKSGGKRLKQEQGRHKRGALRVEEDVSSVGQQGEGTSTSEVSQPGKCAASEGSFRRPIQSIPGSGTMQDLMTYRFQTVLVDPPRSGLDTVTLRFLKAHRHILYISCNPEALMRDLAALAKTHEVSRFCVFDHFPYTKHSECGVYLKKRPPRDA